MQIKTIKKVISNKIEDWLSTIADIKLRDKVRKNYLVSGGSITSLLLNTEVNDYDVYIQDIDVLVELANYYCPNLVLDGRKKDELIKLHYKSKYGHSYLDCLEDYLTGDLSSQTVRLKTLKDNQIKLNIPSEGIKKDLLSVEGQPPAKYQVAFLSQNAISLTDDLQIVLRFSGTVEEIHKTFDFIHVTNYFTHDKGLVTNIDALHCIITKSLKYQGSLYPLTSIIRMKKFLLRGWSINAGEILKIMFQISELNLKSPEILEEQLIGVDIAYFAKLISVLRNTKEEVSSSFLNTLIDKIFNDEESGN